MTDNMHVLYLMGQDSGGLPHYTAALANAAADYARVSVLKATATSADDMLDEDVEVYNVFKPTKISMQNLFDFNIPIKKNLIGLFSYRNIRLVNQLDPDIVHDPTDEFPQVSLFSYVYSVYKNRPYVVTLHEVEHGSGELIMKLADAVISSVPDFPKDAAIVHSEGQRNALLAQDRNIDTISVIPHGVHTFFNDYDYEKKPEEENHALFFGSLIPPKGIEYLINAVPYVVERLPDFTLTIAGKGDIPEGCSSVIQEYSDHISIRNEFIPNDEVGVLFSRSQVVVLPYKSGWQTGHSGTLSTAFAFEKPVVTSHVGEFPELVEDTGAGVVVEPENERAVADGIIEVLTDEKKRRHMAESSGEMADKLSWESVAKQHLNLYKSLSQ